MRAVVSRISADGSYTARTDNDLALVFGVAQGSLPLGCVLDVDLLSVVETQRLRRIDDDQLLEIRMGSHDIHDLRSSGRGEHFVPSHVSTARLLAP